MRLAMLKDPSFPQKCKRRVREDLVRVEHAVLAEVREMEIRLQGLKQEFMRERSADVRDLGHQILRNLRTSGKGPRTDWPPSRREPFWSLRNFFCPMRCRSIPINVAAIVTERTGPASHVAILARVRHIPAVCDIKDATLLLASGDRLLVDAEAGTVTVAPTQAQATRFATRKTQSALFATAAAQEPVQHCITKDGVDIGLHANIGRPDEAAVVLEYRLDGVGLFRSEFLFLDVRTAAGPGDSNCGLFRGGNHA